MLSGTSYLLELEGDRYDFEESFGIGYMEHTSYYFCWRGSGKLVRLSDRAGWGFTFETPTVNRNGNWAGYYGQSLERNIFIITGDRRPTNHNRVISIDRLVDLQVENIFRQVKSALSTPKVHIGLLKIEKLRELGLLPMADGQFLMPELILI